VRVWAVACERGEGNMNSCGMGWDGMERKQILEYVRFQGFGGHSYIYKRLSFQV